MPDVDPACALPSLRPRPTSPARRRPRAWVVAAVVVAGLVGCGDDPQVSCGDAYEHLLTIGHRNHDAELRARFVKACVEAWDERKVACIQRAETPEAALACKWYKKRPG